MSVREEKIERLAQRDANNEKVDGECQYTAASNNQLLLLHNIALPAVHE
jgi:hypothetical protein